MHDEHHARKSVIFHALLLGAFLFMTGCGSGGGESPADGADTGLPDHVADLGPEIADVGPDVAPDAMPETMGDVDAGPDVVADVLLDTGPPPCEADEWACSDDGYELQRCVDGTWETVACMRDEGRLCENGQCVDPWWYGSPVWSTCPDEPRATAESLSEKAAYYDDIARRVHVHPDLKWIADVDLQREEVTCEPGQDPPCYGDQPAVPEALATYEDVARWHTGENDGLWSGLYLASQAYRYAATGSPDALDNVRLLLEGEVTRMRITGVPGLFTRQFIPPGVPGIGCPTADHEYVVDVEKDDNQWVQIRDDGCVWVVDNVTQEWTGTDHCGLDEYAGYCFLDNVSVDEYHGHMFLLGVLARLVDAADVQATVSDLLEQVADHLMANDLTFVDWDGRVTEHGRLYPMSMTDTPGFNAATSLGFILMAAEVTGREDIRAYYDDCLLQKSGINECLPWPLQDAEPFTEFFQYMIMYVGLDGCGTNFNNVSMMFCAFHNLFQYEWDPEWREIIQEAFNTEVVRAEVRIPAGTYRNPWYNFIWAAGKRLGPGSDGPAYDAVEQAICSLRQFDTSEHQPDKDSETPYPHYCEGRLGDSLAEFAIPPADRCPSTFIWWSNPFKRHTCSERLWEIRQPGDYLLAYWMGRYYGFIPQDL